MHNKQVRAHPSSRYETYNKQKQLASVSATFSLPVRIYYEDTDLAGVVYYANYLKFMERARTEWLRNYGYEQDEIIASDAVVFAVRSVTINYLKPGRFNDLLTVTARISKWGSASITFEQNVLNGEEVLCRGEVRIACLDSNTFTPRTIPERIIQTLKKSGVLTGND